MTYKNLFIAEKPSVAQQFGAALGEESSLVPVFCSFICSFLGPCFLFRPLRVNGSLAAADGFFTLRGLGSVLGTSGGSSSDVGDWSSTSM